MLEAQPPSDACPRDARPEEMERQAESTYETVSKLKNNVDIYVLFLSPTRLTV